MSPTPYSTPNPGNIDAVNKQVAADLADLTLSIKTGKETAVDPSKTANNMVTALLSDPASVAALGGTQGVLSSARYTGQGMVYAAQQAEKEKAAADAAAAKAEARHKGTYAQGVAEIGPIGPAALKAMGYWSAGGFIPKGTDTIPAMLAPGEFVMSKYAVDNFGVNNLKAINSGSKNVSGDSVYNYSLTVNAGSNASPDDIAKTVMNQIKQIDSQRIRGVRI